LLREANLYCAPRLHTHRIIISSFYPFKPPDLCLVKVTKGVKLQDRFYKMPM